LRQGDALSLLFSNFDSEHAIKKVQVNQDDLKLNGKRQLLVYADDVRILGRSLHTIKKNTEALEVASKEAGLEVNTDKTKCMIMSREQTAGWSHNIQIDNSSFERVEQFKYLGRTLTYQNSIQEEIKSILLSGNAGYHSVKNLLCPVCNLKIERLRYTEL